MILHNQVFPRKTLFWYHIFDEIYIQKASFDTFQAKNGWLFTLQSDFKIPQKIDVWGIFTSNWQKYNFQGKDCGVNNPSIFDPNVSIEACNNLEEFVSNQLGFMEQ